MVQVPLNYGAYVARSITADDQRCVNLFLEPSPGGSPFPTSHYPAPGLRGLSTAPTAGCRCLYTASNGQLYGVYGSAVYSIDRTWAFTSLGTIGGAATPVSMRDNGFDLLIVDGSTLGWTMPLGGSAIVLVSDPNFYGATRVDICDTYFVLNRPGTNNWYISLTNQVAFDALDIASKTGSPDPISTVIVMHNEPWTLGTKTSQVWYDAGAADFTFASMPGVFIEQGCAAAHSAAKYDLSIYWLSQNEAGQYIVMRGNSYAAERISTFAIEAEISSYGDVSDAIGFCFQIGGHAFYQLTFPSADRTWVWDEATKFWHERVWIDTNGHWHRHRANAAAFAYGVNVCGDWETGDLYALDLDTYTDNNNPILYLRTFPHMVKDSKRVTYQRFVVDMEVGTLEGSTPDNPPMVSLRWSDDRGATFGDAVQMPMGAAGQYDTSIQFWGLGMARDRVFEVSWSAPMRTALNGGWLDVIPHGT
jgi:hypothetical protein